MAVVINSIPKGTVDVVMRGSLTKVAYAIASALCRNGIKVTTLRKDEYDKLMGRIPHEWRDRLLYSTSKTLPSHKIWLVGEGMDEKEQERATQGSVFIPFSQFPPKELRRDCLYHTTPALTVPKSLENIHSCENWLPRKAISAARAAGIVHALEGWEWHECGSSLLHDLDAIWDASLSHGFRRTIWTSVERVIDVAT